MMQLGLFELAIFVIMGLSVVWAFLGLLVLGRALRVRWGWLASLATVPLVVLVLFIMSGIFGILDRLQPGNVKYVLPMIFAAVFLPWPLLITLLARAARRMKMADGGMVAEVFR